MKPNLIPHLIFAFICFLCFTPVLLAQKSGIEVTNTNGAWTIAGKKQTITFKESDLSIRIKSENETWNLVPSGTGDMIDKRN